MHQLTSIFIKIISKKALIIPKNKPKKLSFKEQRELDSMMDLIAANDEKTAELEAMFSDPDFYAKYGSQRTALQEQLDELRAESIRLYARWDELENKQRELAGQ